MKKLLTIVLIVAMLLCIFVACDSESTDGGNKGTTTTQKSTENSKNNSNSSGNNSTKIPDNDGESSPENNNLNTVSAEEWKSAFDFSALESFTLKITEAEKSEITEITNMAYDGYLYTANGNDRELRELSTYRITEFDSQWLSELSSELDDMDDYGYSKFTYSDSTDSYTAKIEVDIPDCDVTVKFENKRISKITIDIYGTMGGDSYIYDIDCTYIFSNYNSTTAPEDAKYLVTSEQWKSAFELSDLDYYKYTSTHIEGNYTDVISVEYDSSLSEYTVITNGDSSSCTGTPEGFREMGSYGFYISEFIIEYSERYYGFYNFSYNNSKYTASMEIDGCDIDAEVFFLNGKIEKIVLTGEESSQTLTISYEK